eukprot:Colp12_sorted_trinity150504_noHs@18630
MNGVSEDGGDWDAAVAASPADPIDRSIRAAVQARDPLFYIFTSGTTGKSKAAKFSHLRFIGAGLAWAPPCQLTSSDVYYITLPLYHGNAGAVALSPCYWSGCTMVIREKFSASNFFKDVRKYQCTATVYIGEIWRYIFLQPPREDDADNPLRVIVGNGLRGDIWEAVCKRFNIQRVVEHFGATEMPGGAVLNWTNKVGSCGYVPPSLRKEADADRVIEYDLATNQPLRGADGLLVVCPPNKPGELLMKLDDGKYDGYVSDTDTARKLYHDVIAPGDTWWASGDLLRIDDDGFYYFVDRAGDSYRWKGENVSTNDVCHVVSAFPGINEANVYGVAVPNNYGKCGMASLVIDDVSNFDFAGFYAHVTADLPSYARPYFLRIKDDWNDKTSTYKFQKHTYSLQGFDPSNPAIKDPMFFMHPSEKTYIPLTKEVYDDICQGKYHL